MVRSTRPVARGKASARIALVDDHPLILKGLKALIDRMRGYHVVLQVRNSRDLIDQLDGRRVDITLIDLKMAAMDGLKTLTWLGENHPTMRVLALTDLDQPEWQKGVLEGGACGIMLKHHADEISLRMAFDEIMLTGNYRSPSDAAGTKESSPSERRFFDREMEFMRLVCDPADLTYDQIAERMKVSRHTVDGYFRSLGKRFDLHSRARLVRFAMDLGLS
jgi:two-component system response regulator NreC